VALADARELRTRAFTRSCIEFEKRETDAHPWGGEGLRICSRRRGPSHRVARNEKLRHLAGASCPIDDGRAIRAHAGSHSVAHLTGGLPGSIWERNQRRSAFTQPIEGAADISIAIAS